MKCPHCGKEITPEEAARALRAIDSEARTAASRENGKKGGRPRKNVSSLPNDETLDIGPCRVRIEAAQPTKKPDI